jgi:hypothetical protein
VGKRERGIRLPLINEKKEEGEIVTRRRKDRNNEGPR